MQPGEWARVVRAGLPGLRTLRGWSQAELARRSGLHRRTVWRLEQVGDGCLEPTRQTVTALARAFGYVQLSAFWTALQGAVATDPGTPLVVGARMRQLVEAFMDLTPQQQRFLEGIILCWSARQQAEALGATHVLDLDLMFGRRTEGA
jgi:transcriptional regulator with XRE-family HTH domain